MFTTSPNQGEYNNGLRQFNFYIGIKLTLTFKIFSRMISYLDIVWFPQQHLCQFVTSFIRDEYQKYARKHSMKPLRDIVVTKEPIHILSIVTASDIFPLNFFEDLRLQVTLHNISQSTKIPNFLCGHHKGHSPFSTPIGSVYTLLFVVTSAHIFVNQSQKSFALPASL